MFAAKFDNLNLITGKRKSIPTCQPWHAQSLYSIIPPPSPPPIKIIPANIIFIFFLHLRKADLSLTCHGHCQSSCGYLHKIEPHHVGVGEPWEASPFPEDLLVVDAGGKRCHFPQCCSHLFSCPNKSTPNLCSCKQTQLSRS